MKLNKEQCITTINSIEEQIEEIYIRKAKIRFLNEIGKSNYFGDLRQSERDMDNRMERLVEDRNIILKELEDINILEAREYDLNEIYNKYKKL